jgi:UDP-glucose:(galactosyl)LPS alpha-1,2-glucosyltransferase
LNILVTLNAGYLPQLAVMLTSLVACHPNRTFTVYVLHTSLTSQQIRALGRVYPGRCRIVGVRAPQNFLFDAPTSRRYPAEMYYRIFAAQLLPEGLERILYLDPDLVIINPIEALYGLDFGGMLLAAASHVISPQLNRINELRLSMPDSRPYYNSGVMLMNLSLLRREQSQSEVLDYIRTHKNVLMLPDQDVVNAVYGAHILPIDPLRYNLSERFFRRYNLGRERWGNRLDLQWVRNNACIIHYCGRNKPWNKNYIGEFDCFYRRYERLAKERDLL